MILPAILQRNIIKECPTNNIVTCGWRGQHCDCACQDIDTHGLESPTDGNVRLKIRDHDLSAPQTLGRKFVSFRYYRIDHRLYATQQPLGAIEYYKVAEAILTRTKIYPNRIRKRKALYGTTSYKGGRRCSGEAKHRDTE